MATLQKTSVMLHGMSLTCFLNFVTLQHFCVVKVTKNIFFSLKKSFYIVVPELWQIFLV